MKLPVNRFPQRGMHRIYFQSCTHIRPVVARLISDFAHKNPFLLSATCVGAIFLAWHRNRGRSARPNGSLRLRDAR